MATKTKKSRRWKATSHQKGSDRKWSGKVKTVSTYPPEGLYTKDAENDRPSDGDEKSQSEGDRLGDPDGAVFH